MQCTLWAKTASLYHWDLQTMPPDSLPLSSLYSSFFLMLLCQVENEITLWAEMQTWKKRIWLNCKYIKKVLISKVQATTYWSIHRWSLTCCWYYFSKVIFISSWMINTTQHTHRKSNKPRAWIPRWDLLFLIRTKQRVPTSYNLCKEADTFYRFQYTSHRGPKFSSLSLMYHVVLATANDSNVVPGRYFVGYCFESFYVFFKL